MAKSSFINCRVSPETKAALHALAAEDGLTETELLTRSIETLLMMAGRRRLQKAMTRQEEPDDDRVKVCLAPGDKRLLTDRAAARGLTPATYLAVAVRTHLRGVSPIPGREYAALRETVAELRAISRALQQIARAADNGAKISGPDRQGFAAFLQVAQNLRDNFKALLKANAKSWGIEDADAER